MTPQVNVIFQTSAVYILLDKKYLSDLSGDSEEHLAPFWNTKIQAIPQMSLSYQEEGKSSAL